MNNSIERYYALREFPIDEQEYHTYASANLCVFCAKEHRFNRWMQEIDLEELDSLYCCSSCNSELTGLESNRIDEMITYEDAIISVRFCLNSEFSGWSFIISFPKLHDHYSWDSYSEGDGMLFKTRKLAMTAGISQYIEFDIFKEQKIINDT